MHDVVCPSPGFDRCIPLCNLNPYQDNRALLLTWKVISRPFLVNPCPHALEATLIQIFSSINSSLFWIYWFLGDGLLNTCYSKCGPQSWSISIKWELVRSAELCPRPRPTESESSLLQESQVNWVHIIIWEALDYRHLSESFPVQTLSFAFSLESHYDSCRIILVLPRTVAPWYTEFCKIAGEIV